MVLSDIHPPIQAIDKGELDGYGWRDGKWVKLVFGSPVSGLEKDRDQTGPEPIRTANDQDW